MSMIDISHSWTKPGAGLPQNQLRLRTLVRLRWLAVAGQVAALTFVSVGLGFRLPLLACLCIVGCSALLNIVLSLRWRSGDLLSARAAGLQLTYDLIALGLLLYCTGGLENPFAILFLVPVTVSASSLPPRWTVFLGGLAFFIASVLAKLHIPLPWSAVQPLVLPPTYVAGMWVAVLCGTGFAALFAARVAEEKNLMAAALAATETVLAREQRLSALDGLAAAAAHELGTPLATIALVAKELKREVPRNSPHADDIDLLISQAARCREILTKLANLDQASDEIYSQMKLSVMIEELVAPLRGSDVEVRIDCQPLDKAGSGEPVLMRSPGIPYGLSNILANAIDFAESEVLVQARWDVQNVSVLIRDDGPGFDPNILHRLGDPYVTTRPGYGQETGSNLPAPGAERGLPDHDGMGLGLFIAKTLLERSGARVSLANRPAPEHGASITLTWPRTSIDLNPGQAKKLDPHHATLH